MRQIWNQYYDEAAGVVLVVDAADHRRLNEALSVAVEVLRSSRLEGVPLLILANKNDKVGAVDAQTLYTRLVESLRDGGVRDLPSSAAAGGGSASSASAGKSSRAAPAMHIQLLRHAVIIASISALACDGVKESVQAFIPSVRENAVASKAAAARSS